MARDIKREVDFRCASYVHALSSLTFDQRGHVGLDFCSCPVYFREAISLRLVQNGSITQGYRCGHATRARWNSAIARNPIYNLRSVVAHFQYDPDNFGGDIANACTRLRDDPQTFPLINRRPRLPEFRVIGIAVFRFGSLATQGCVVAMITDTPFHLRSVFGVMKRRERFCQQQRQ